MLDSMTGQYCDGETDDTKKDQDVEGYANKTCKKALSVFYATCKEKGLDYTKPMPKEKVREHVSAILPFQILEKIVDKPLKIRGLAITAGMSRNFNIYTPEELQAFSSKLVAAPVYVEHVAVPNAVGKVTKTEWDGSNLFYEAEIYDEETAAKIRKGLIQHVSVGADYETLDIVDGQVPHDLHNAELSLVAVPGIPEANVQVLEKLAPAGDSAVGKAPLIERGNMKKKRKIKEQNQGQGEPKTDKQRFIDQFSIDEDAFQKLYDILGDELFKLLPERGQKVTEQNGEGNGGQNLTIDQIKAKIADLSKKNADIMAQLYPEAELTDEQRATLNAESETIWAEINALETALTQLITAQVGATLGEGYQVVLEVKLKEAAAKKKLCAAVKTWNEAHSDDQITSDVCGVEPSNQEQLLEAKVTELLARVDKLEKAHGGAQGNLSESLLKKSKEPTIKVTEVIKILEGLLPSPMVERSSMGMQRECQAIRGAILQLKEMLKNG